MNLSSKTLSSCDFCLQVVANIPFNISTDVVKQLLPMGDIFSDVVLLLQVSATFNLLKKLALLYLFFIDFCSFNLWLNIVS